MADRGLKSLKKKFSRFEKKSRVIPAKLGNGAGVVRVPGRKFQVYARVSDHGKIGRAHV